MSRARYFILDGHNVVPVKGLLTWGMWFERADRRVGDDHIELPGHDAVRVSTVFLGVDHGWGDGPPLIFETMIFGGPLNETCWRYSTWEQAEAGHRMFVEEATLEGHVATWELNEALKKIGAVQK